MANEPISKEDMRQLLNQQAQMLAGLIRSNTKDGNTSYTPPTYNPYDYSSSGSLFKTATTGIISDLGKLGAGTYDVSAVLKDATGIVSHFGTAGRIAAQVLGQVGDGAISINLAMQETARYGMSFGLNIAGFNEAILKAGLTVPEFVGIVQQSSRQLTGLFGGASTSGKAFLDLLQDFQKSDVAKDLKEIGVQSRELADAMVLQSSTMTFANLKDADSKRLAYIAAGGLAEELLKVSDLTGKNRKQQETELQNIQSRADVQAAVLKSMKTDAEFGTKLNEATIAIGPLGQRAQQALAEIATAGSVHTPALIEYMASLGPAGDQIEQLGLAVKNGTVAQVKGMEATTRAAVVTEMTSDQYLDNMSYMNGSILGAGKDLNDANSYLKAVQGERLRLAEEDSKATGKKISLDQIDVARAEKSLIDKGELDRKGKVLKPSGDKEDDPRAALAKTLNDLNQIGKAASGVTAGMFDALNTQLSTVNKEGLTNFNNALKKLSDPASLSSGFKDSIDGLRRDILTAAGIKPATRTPGTNELLNNPPKPETPNKDTGSPGTVGSMVEDFGKGTLIETHGREGVLTEQQQLNLVRGSVDTGSKDAFANMQRTLTAMISSVNTKEPSANPEARETVKIDSDVLADKINNIKVPDFTEPLNQFISQFSKITPPDFSEVEGHVIKEASKIKFPDFAPIFDDVSNKMSQVQIPDFAPIFNDVSNKMSQVQIPDFTKPLDDVSNKMSQVQIPDLAPIFNDVSNKMSQVQIPDFAPIFNDVSNKMSQVQIPDLAPIFNDVSNKMSQVQIPDFTKPLDDLSNQIGTFEIPDPIEPSSDGIKDLTGKMESIFKQLAGDFDATIKGPDRLTDFLDKSNINTEELNNQITQIKAPDFNNLPVFRDILTTLTTNKTETTTKTETETAKREDTERLAPVQRDASLKDVVDHLDKLNKSIMQMVGHTEKLTDYSNKQIRATQSLSNNRFAM